MADQQAPFELLKTFSGLIHRQPLFIASELNVDSYHLSFLDIHGQKLNDDSQVPDFIEKLPAILPAINHRQKALLTIPESWQDALLNLQNIGMELTLDIDDIDVPDINNKAFSFACHANDTNGHGHSKTLLIDLQQFKPQDLDKQMPQWRQAHQILCATNVNAAAQYKFCMKNDLDLLQGMFYTLPDAKDNQKVAPSAQTLMELLVKLQEPNVEPEELADTINQDVTLSYKLLRLINSAFFGLPREVSNTKQAVMMLGLNKVKTWASLLCLSGMDDKPNELRSVAMIRARMCELLAKYYKGQSDTFFAVGLFSTLDALMDRPLAEIVEKLPLSPELKIALTEHQGPAGFALQDALHYERGQWEELENSPMPQEVLVRTYLDSINWTKELNLELKD
ncbi:EAL and HDOD domain-containing protein [Methylophaga sp.]|uniref:EAL and HDOD domain-containing protein n=1 Tax=Methylophaga sp. TaxID=2024840 RepID=UPI003F697268